MGPTVGLSHGTGQSDPFCWKAAACSSHCQRPVMMIVVTGNSGNWHRSLATLHLHAMQCMSDMHCMSGVHSCSKRLVTTAHADIEYARLPASRQKRAFTMRPTIQKFLILSPILCMHVQVEMSWRNNGDLLANRTICSGDIPDCAASAAAAATGSIILYEGRDEIGDKASQFPAVAPKSRQEGLAQWCPSSCRSGSPHPC